MLAIPTTIGTQMPAKMGVLRRRKNAAPIWPKQNSAKSVPLAMHQVIHERPLRGSVIQSSQSAVSEGPAHTNTQPGGRVAG